MAKKRALKKVALRARSKRPLAIGTLVSLTDVWPQERDVMERPHRYKYVRKLLPDNGCVFCDALKPGSPTASQVLKQTPNAFVVLNKFPYNTGHIMVLPKIHGGDLINLPLAIHLEIQTELQNAVVILQKAYHCAGFNIGLNLGAVAGAGIPEHLHWHVVPRWAGDTNFFPLIAETKVLPESLEQTYARLKPLFEGAK